MKTFKVTAIVRQYGAIGLFGAAVFTVESDSKENAIKELYESKMYDFQMLPSVVELTPEE